MNKGIVSGDFYSNPCEESYLKYKRYLKLSEARGEIMPHDVEYILTQARAMLDKPYKNTYGRYHMLDDDKGDLWTDTDDSDYELPTGVDDDYS